MIRMAQPDHFTRLFRMAVVMYFEMILNQNDSLGPTRQQQCSQENNIITQFLILALFCQYLTKKFI